MHGSKIGRRKKEEEEMHGSIREQDSSKRDINQIPSLSK